MLIVRALVIAALAGTAAGCVSTARPDKVENAADAWKDTPNRAGDPIRGRWW